MRSDIDSVRDSMVAEVGRMEHLLLGSSANSKKLEEDLHYFFHRRDDLYDEAAFVQHDLDDNRDALILFCQQFAFAQDMATPCRALLTCNEKQIYYRYAFSGDY